MGLFDKLFAKKPAAPAPSKPPADVREDDLRPTTAPPIQGPPEVVRAVELQRAYWTHNPQEQSRLEARLEAHGVEQLTWPERLRLHHLICLQRLEAGSDRAASTAKCEASVQRLIAADSPYRPRPAAVWQGRSSAPGAEREPDLQGDFLNPSLTHLGCIEVCRVDAANMPTRIDFVSFDDLSGIFFAPPSLFRAAKLFYEGGRSEIVLVPMLYGTTWSIGNEHDRAGTMTRFVAHLESDVIRPLNAAGIGVGQQDLSIRPRDGGARLFGLSSVAEISFPLDMRDPRFDEKARGRGIDPGEVRRRMGAA